MDFSYTFSVILILIKFARVPVTTIKQQALKVLVQRIFVLVNEVADVVLDIPSVMPDAELGLYSQALVSQMSVSRCEMLVAF